MTDPTNDDAVIKEIQALRLDIGQMSDAFAAMANAIKGVAPALVPAAEPKPLPAPVPPPATVPAPAPASTTPVLDRPGVGLGMFGAIASAVLASLGVVGPPAGETATTTGQLLPILSAGTALLGATGTWGSVLNALGTVISMFNNRAPTK